MPSMPSTYEHRARRAVSQAASARRDAQAARHLVASPTWSHRGDYLREWAAVLDQVALLFEALAIEALVGLAAEGRARGVSPVAGDAEPHVTPAVSKPHLRVLSG
jgi:hypothetical protein